MPRPRSHTDSPATLATVAAAVGVSRMTVSNAYNRPDQLSPALRERVLATARELGYPGPNPVARTLSRGVTGSVGLIIDKPLTEAFEDPATVMFLHGVAAGCEERARGLSLVPRIVGRDAALVHTALVDGFILYGASAEGERLAAVHERRLPYVLVDFPDSPDERCVNVDDRGGARAVGEHLVALGHRSFGIVLGFDTPAASAAEAEAGAAWHMRAERLAGWREALVPAGIGWATVPVATAAGGGVETGRRAAAQLLDRADRPTALLCLYDKLALGALEAAAARGIAIPRDLSIAGFDDISEAALTTPSLTTVNQPHTRKGSEAVRLLLDENGADWVRLETELVVRASTGPAPGGSDN
jgi:DNA-binding LacI/PurR family transcriptional regulator